MKIYILSFIKLQIKISQTDASIPEKWDHWQRCRTFFSNKRVWKQA